MNYRISLSLFLLVSCTAGSGQPTGSNTDTASGSGSDTDTGTTQSTDAAPSTGTSEASTPTSTDGDSQGDTDPAGSDSLSQSNTSENPGTDGSGTGSSGDDTTTTGDTSTGDDTTTTDTTTGLCMAQDGPDPVVLGDPDDLAAAAAYVVLAKTAITSVPGTAISGGNIGVSPVTHTAITGFSLVLDPSGVFSTSTTVAAPGKVYAADYVVPTPGNLTKAVLAMQAAYADAAGRVPTDYLDLKSGNLGGLTLAPGIYTWGSTVLIPDDVTLEGCEDDVWILQIAGDLDVSTGKRVLLAGGARADHVFWQIAGQATIHANAHIEGVLLSKTGITFQTKASLNGRAYAQTMVAFDMNAVAAP
jgi:hypothetical protein